MRRCALSLALSVQLFGCQPSLGECDEAAAREVVYDRCGRPAYVGQALVQTSCGNGQYCHGGEVTGAERFGAPHGLNWDVPLVSTSRALDPNGRLDLLRRGQRRLHAERELVWAMVDAEVMPPEGDETAQATTAGPDYFFDGDETRGLGRVQDSAENRDRLRNWLACGSPVVERSFPIEMPAPMPTEVGSIVPRGPVVVRVMPEYTSIFEQVIDVQCASCHRPSSPYFDENRLDMSTVEVAYDNLAGVAAMAETSREPGSPACGGTGATRVVAGDPMGSLLYLKITGDHTCGARMPLNATELCDEEIGAIDTWITGGALR